MSARPALPKARKGRDAKKREIGRGYHHGVPNVEERAIERHERQRGAKEIRRALGEIGGDDVVEARCSIYGEETGRPSAPRRPER